MNKKLTAAVTTGLVIAIACGTATSAQAAGSSFGPAATQQTASSTSSTADAFDTTKTPTVTDQGAVPGTPNRLIRIDGQPAAHTVFEIYVNGAHWRSVAADSGSADHLQVTSSALHRFGPNTVQVRQRLFWVGNQTTSLAAMTYNANQQVPPADSFLETQAPVPAEADAIQTYNEQGVAIVRLDHRNVPGATVKAVVNGREFTQANLGSTQSVLELSGLRVGENDVSFTQVAEDGRSTITTDGTITLLDTPTVGRPVPGADDRVVIPIDAAEEGTYVLRDADGTEIDRTTTSGKSRTSASAKARASVELTAPAGDTATELYVTRIVGSAESDPRAVVVPAVGAGQTAAPTITSVTPHGATATIAVSAPAGGVVAFRDADGRTVASGDLEAEGDHFVLRQAVWLADDASTLQAVRFDDDANASEPVQVELPAKTADADDAAHQVAVTSGTEYEPNSTTTIEGTAPAGSTVEITLAALDGASREVTVPSSGKWSFTTPTLNAAAYPGNTVAAYLGGELHSTTTFDLTQASAATPFVGVQDRTATTALLGVSLATRSGTIDVYRGTEKLATAEHDGTFGAASSIPVEVGAEATDLRVVMTVDGFPTKDVTVHVAAATPAAGEYVPATLTSAQSYLPGGKQTLRGRGTPGASVTVELPFIPFEKTVEVAANGTWSVKVPLTHDGGYRTNRITQHADTGTNTFPFDLSAAVETDRPAEKDTVTVAKPVFAGTGDAGAVVTVTDRDSGIDLGTTTVDEDGNWTLTAARELTDGKHTADVHQVPLNG